MFVPLQFNKGNLQRLIVNVTGVVNSWSAGSTGLTPVAASSGNVVLAGVLNVVNGGTGVTTSTGSGSNVLNTSAQLVTPNIGAAVGTSIDLTSYATIAQGLSATVGGSTTGYRFFNTTAIGVFTGTGSPTISVARGSLYLRNDGLPYYNTNGTTGWSPVAGATATKVTTFTAGGTWFVDPRTLYAQIEAWGNGGGGGAAANAGATQQVFAASGGAGSYSRATVSKATAGTSQSVTFGATGAGGTAGNPGTAGGDVAVGSLCIGKGGSGGALATATPGLFAGGAGGVVGTGDVTTVGQSGMNGIAVSTTVADGFVIPGVTGGSTAVGNGGLSPVATGTGGAGTKGGGGSGGYSVAAGGAAAGGAGGTGYVVITEYMAA